MHVLLFAFLAATDCSQLTPPEIAKIIAGLHDIPSDATQLVVATNRETECVQATVLTLVRGASGWQQALPAIPAVVGRKGFASPGSKREGDGKSPTGVFALGTAFGYAASGKTKLPYRQTTAEDVWVDDAASADYNRWMQKSVTSAKSFERLKRTDGLYENAVVVEYNTQPVVAGNGSAIFLHIWRASDKPTAGCVAAAKPSVLSLMSWLDPAQSPRIVMGTFREVCGCSL